MSQLNAQLHAQSKAQTEIVIQPLCAESFAAFGEVISSEGHDFFHINHAETERYHALSQAVAEGDAHIAVSLFRNLKSTAIPFQVNMLERHPLGSQTFIPMQGQVFLIVVAPALDADRPDISRLQVFISNGSQGVNYRIGTWHHPLLTLEAPSDFAVIDRIGPGHNCDVFSFAPLQIVLP
ncbi:ureidoglycolate lyase [Acinetobacter sp. WZC-1]|uniref:ureidoglycolate lyase n=1 Tax=Acinetobacter sp. WZC-1 TaxID=3459034 RepID=UPI00403E139B